MQQDDGKVVAHRMANFSWAGPRLLHHDGGSKQAVAQLVLMGRRMQDSDLN